MHILIEIFVHLLILFAHHCKIKIIVHNLCMLFSQDKLSNFKASDNHGTKYYQKVGPIFISITEM